MKKRVDDLNPNVEDNDFNIESSAFQMDLSPTWKKVNARDGGNDNNIQEYNDNNDNDNNNDNNDNDSNGNDNNNGDGITQPKLNTYNNNVNHPLSKGIIFSRSIPDIKILNQQQRTEEEIIMPNNDFNVKKSNSMNLADKRKGVSPAILVDSSQLKPSTAGGITKGIGSIKNVPGKLINNTFLNKKDNKDENDNNCMKSDSD
eukprot:Pgem_evm1s19696